MDFSFDEDQSGSTELIAVDQEDLNLSFSISEGEFISHFIFASTATFSAPSNFNGSENFTITVTDSGGLTDTQIITVTVNAVNDAPVADTGLSGTGDEDQSISILLSGSDVDGDVLSYNITSNPTNGTVEISGSNAVYTPSENYNGSDSFTFKVEDPDGEFDTADVTLTVNAVNDAPVLSEDTPSNVSFDEDGSSDAISLTASDNDTDDTQTYTITEGVEIESDLSESGELSFTAPSNFNGSENFTITVTDSGGLTDTQIITVTVNAVNDAPVADTGLSGTGDEDQSISILLSGSDVDGDVLSYNITSNPTNGTVEISGSNAVYTPSENYNGSDSFTFKVEDPDGEFDTADVTLTVNAVNDAPVLNNILDFSFDEDQTFTLEISIEEILYENENLVYSVSSGSSIIASVENNLIIFSPLDNFNGIESFVISVTDGELSDSQIVVVTINPVNDAPDAISFGIDANEDESTAIILDGIDVDGDQIEYIITSNPQGTILDGPNGPIVTYISPLNALDNDGNFIENDSFTYTVSDGNLISNEATVNIMINDINDFPTVEVIPDSSIYEDNIFSYTIVATDIDGDDLTYEPVAEENALLWFTDNILFVQPNENYYGELSISVIVSDGLLNTFAEFNLNVESINDPPVAGNNYEQLYEDTSLTFSFNATDVDDFNLEFNVDEPPLNGTYEINSGFITYTPNENFYGLEELYFEVCDDDDACASGAIQIEVLNIDDPLLIVSEPIEGAIEDQEYIYQIIVLNPTLENPDPEILSYTLSGDVPEGMELSNEGLLTWTPLEGITTSGEITITVNDQNEYIGNPDGGNSDWQTFTISVQQVNDPPVIASVPSQYSYVDTEYSLQLQVDDPDNENLIYELLNEPQGMSIDNTGFIYWFPELTGYYPDITITVSDGEFLVEEIFDIDIKFLQNFNFHTGNNLISFMGLNEDDNSIETIFAPIQEDLTHIFSENAASIYLDDYNDGAWFGSINTVKPQNGYWIRLNQNNYLNFETYRFVDEENTLIYDMHYGNNLISYIGKESYEIDDIFPDDIELLFTDIIGENTSATRDSDGNWIGSLAQNGLQSLKGYWVKVSEDLSFSYTFSNNQIARSKNKLINVSRLDTPDEFYYEQSQNQAFYFIKDVDLLEDEIVNGDWIIAYHNDLVVGARQWFGEYTEIPVMGYDGYDETLGYCDEESSITFKVYKPYINKMIDMEGEYQKWNNLNNNIVKIINEKLLVPEEYKIKNPYPNPFNPIINVDIEIPENQNVKIYIYDIRGRLVEKLFNNYPLEKGYHTISWDASYYSSGIYFMKFESTNRSIVKKVTLIK